MKQEKVLVKRQRWYLGGVASGMAVCVTHPLDLLKVCTVAIPTKMSQIVAKYFRVGQMIKIGGNRPYPMVACALCYQRHQEAVIITCLHFKIKHAIKLI